MTTKKTKKWNKAQQTCYNVDCTKIKNCQDCIIYDIFKEEENKKP